MKNMRNGFIGVYEVQDLSDNQTSIHFNEWWNGEGMDFHIESSNKEQKIGLTIEQIRAMMVIAFATGMLVMEDVESEASELLNDSIERRKNIIHLRQKYQEMHRE